MTKIKLLIFSTLKRKIRIKTTICFFSSKPRLCFCPLVAALNQKQLDCRGVSVALKDVLTPDPKPETKTGRFLLTRGLLALFCEIHTCRVSLVHVHGFPIWGPPTPLLSDVIWPK